MKTIIIDGVKHEIDVARSIELGVLKKLPKERPIYARDLKIGDVFSFGTNPYGYSCYKYMFVGEGKVVYLGKGSKPSGELLSFGKLFNGLDKSVSPNGETLPLTLYSINIDYYEPTNRITE